MNAEQQILLVLFATFSWGLVAAWVLLVHHARSVRKLRDEYHQRNSRIREEYAADSRSGGES